MKRKPWGEALAVAAFLMAVTWLIAASGADLAVSSRFYINGGWPVGDHYPWHALYKMDRFPSISLALVSLLSALYSLKDRSFLPWRRRSAFFVLLLIIVPGLLVNSYFKNHWGRPRPREIVQFGGQKEFLQPWQRGEVGKGRSFPSGHASAAFYMTAPFFVYRRRRPRLARAWLAGGLVFGVLMSIARIVQGGHFLSDNLWAWGMVHLTALFLAALLGLDREEASETAHTDS